MANPPIIFGQPTGTTAFSRSWQGQPGYWTVPPSGYFYRSSPIATNRLQFSPNSDFSAPVYECVMDYDGTFCFQDQLANKITGNGEQTP